MPKSNNIFNEGIDRDTSVEFVSNQSAYKIRNGIISKKGNIGSVSTAKGFRQISGNININHQDSNVYIMKGISSPIAPNNTILIEPFIPWIITNTSNQDITTIDDLFDELKKNTQLELYKTPDAIYLFSVNLLGNINSSIEYDHIGYLNYNNIIGFKEISIDHSHNMIFLFRQPSDDSSVTIIQYIYYNINTFEIESQAIIFKGKVPFSRMDPDNIIYLKEGEERHSLYLCDGVNPDKVIYINQSLDYKNYPNKPVFHLDLRKELYSQVADKFSQNTSQFFPKPKLYDLVEDSSSSVLSCETLVFFYVLSNENENSNVSLFSEIVNIPKSDIYNTVRGEMDYSPIGDNTFYVEFYTEGLPNTYNSITGYVIHYNREGTFKVREIEQQSIKSQNIFRYGESFEDEAIPEVSISSLYNVKSSFNISKEQIVFKNRIIKANLKDEMLGTLQNYDTRAYRFDSSGIAKLYNIQGQEEVTLDASNLNYNINKKFDCINKYNDEITDHDDWQDNQQYKFKADGITIGGEGPNISYEIYQKEVETIRLNTTGEPSHTNLMDATEKYYSTPKTLKTPAGKITYDGPITPFGQNKGYQNGEIYRFFFILWKGDQPSLGSWIGDIKFPENDKLVVSSTDSEPGELLTTYINQIRFEVNTEPLKGIATAFSIGYVPREYDNRSVLATLPITSPDSMTNVTINTSGWGAEDSSSSPSVNTPLVKRDFFDNIDYIIGDYNHSSSMTFFGQYLKSIPLSLDELGILQNDDFSDIYLKNKTNGEFSRTTFDMSYITSDLHGSSTEIYWESVPYNVSEYQKNEILFSHKRIKNINTNFTQTPEPPNHLSKIIQKTTLGRISQSFNAEIVPNTLDPSSYIQIEEWLPDLNETGNVVVRSKIRGEYKQGSDASRHWVNTYPQTWFTYRHPVLPVYSTTQYVSPKTIIGLDTNTDGIGSDVLDDFPIVSIIKNPNLQYGGNSFSARISNSITLDNIYQINGLSTIVEPEGDTFNNYLDINISLGYIAVLIDEIGSPQRSTTVPLWRGFSFPVESPLNLYGMKTKSEQNHWRDIRCSSTTISNSSGETPGSFGASLPEINDLLNRSTLSINPRIESYYPTAMIASEKKIIGQAIDYWLQYKVNNQKIIDPNYEDITKLITIKDNLIGFQKHGVFQQFVDRRQTQVNDTSQVVLGTGDVLDEHVYAYRDIGILSSSHIVETTSDIIFRDLLRKRIYSWSKGEIPGINSYLEDLDVIEDSDVFLDYAIFYDKETNLVFMSNKIELPKLLPEDPTTYKEDVIIYDNNLQRVTAIESYQGQNESIRFFSGIYNMIGTKLIDAVGDEFIHIFNNDYSNKWLTSSGLQNQALELEFTVNDDFGISKVFDNITLNYEVKDVDGKDVYDFKPEYIRVYNSYQDTGPININSTNRIRRRGRIWNFQIPRSLALQVGDTSKARIRDKYTRVNILFPATDNHIKVNNVAVSYRYSNI